MQHYNWETGFLLVEPVFPKTVADYQALLDAGDLDKLDDLLMERMDAGPQDIAFFLPAYRSLIKRQETGRAEALLQLHFDCLASREDVNAQSALVQAILGVWPECALAREVVVDHLKTMYADSPNAGQLIKTFSGQDAAKGVAPLRQLELWLRYDEGRILYIPAKGAARVRESNPKLGVIRIVFGNNEQLSLRIDEARRLAQSLPKEHFLAKKYERPGELIRKAESDPAGVLEDVFAGVNKPLALAELRDMLSGVVDEAQWAAWWGRARKDNRLTVSAGTKPVVHWNSSAANAALAIAGQFERASSYEKLALFQQHAKRSEQLGLTMLRGLVCDANAAAKSNPSLALEIALTIEKMPAMDDAPLGLTPEGMLKRGDAAAVIAGIRDRLIRRKAVALLLQVRDDWRDAYLQLLQTESDTHILTALYDTLNAKEHSEACTAAVQRTISDPASTPGFYLWLCKEMTKRHELASLMNGDFLFPLLGVLDHDAFKGHYPALRKLFDLGEAADRAVASLDAPSCRRLLDAIGRDRELEDYRKERVRQEIFQHFPELHENKPQTMYVTQEALEKKRLEFEKLLREDIPHATKEIQRTREYGDLRENFEYHAARHLQEMLSSRAKTLHDELSAVRVIDPATVDASKISIGTRVTLRPRAEGEASLALTILGPWDSDPAKNVLSYTSAAGALLLNAALGATVAFNEKDYFVDKIEVWDK
jgi:transcription elongation GreA/GreB family factor